MNPAHVTPFNHLVGEIQDKNLREACNQLRHYPEFWTWPAAISNHHAYEEGLISHSLEVAWTALHIAEFFRHSRSGVNRDVLVTAALWHDWGKIKEYHVAGLGKIGLNELPKYHLYKGRDESGFVETWVRNPEASTHIATSAIEFSKHCNNPAVVHCILAHHGPVREWGSPEAPRTLEALILHQADMLSAGYGATK